MPEQEDPERPPTPPIEEALAEPADPVEIPPFEPLLDEPLAIEPAPEAVSSLPIGAAERERAAAGAAKACREGRLTLGAYADLVQVLQEADDRAEFEQAVSEARQAAALTTALAPFPQSSPPMIAILSGHDQKGQMRLSEQMTAVAVLGGVDLDLREATVSGPVTTIRAFAFMGGVDVRVPPGVRVETRSIPILGGTDIKLRGAPPRADAPVIRIEIVEVMGGVNVKDYGGGMRELMGQGMALGQAGLTGLSDARLAARQARHEAHRARHEARRAAHDARHNRLR
ncbi:MAG: hypothetical protein ACREOV_03205 [Candidatus Dormibacteraceae bacterium]